MNDKKRGYIFFIVGVLLYSFSDAIMKYFMPVYGTSQIIFCRAAFRFAPFLLFALCKQINPLRTNRLKENIFRAALASLGTAAYMRAYSFSSMTDVFVVGATTAIFIIPLSVWILGEKFCARNVAALFLGFLGICLAFRPGSGILQIGIIFAVVGAFIAALNQIIIKRLTFTDNELTIIFYHHLFLIVASFIVGLPVFSPMTFDHTLIIFAGGLIGATAQYGIIHSFKLSAISELAPAAYVMLIPDVILDFFLYDKIPDIYIIGGLILILIGTREAFLAHSRRRR